MNLKTIMIIDDDADDRLFFKEALSKINSSITCIEAKNGTDALEKLKETISYPDYIFLDLNMPGMNGIDFLKHITTESQLRNIPIIVYTTSVSPDDMAITREFGARYYLPKTADISKLPSKIAFAINMVANINS